MFVKKYFDSTIPAMDLNEDDMKIVALVAKELRTYNDTLEAVRYVFYGLIPCYVYVKICENFHVTKYMLHGM